MRNIKNVLFYGICVFAFGIASLCSAQTATSQVNFAMQRLYKAPLEIDQVFASTNAAAVYAAGATNASYPGQLYSINDGASAATVYVVNYDYTISQLADVTTISNNFAYLTNMINSVSNNTDSLISTVYNYMDGISNHVDSVSNDMENAFGLINTNTYITTNMFEIISRIIGLEGTMLSNYDNYWDSFQTLNNDSGTNFLADPTTFTNIHYSINTNIANIYDQLGGIQVTVDTFFENNVLRLQNDTSEFDYTSPKSNPGSSDFAWNHLPTNWVTFDGASTWCSNNVDGTVVITFPTTAVYRITMWNWYQCQTNVGFGFSRNNSLTNVWNLPVGAVISNYQAGTISYVGVIPADEQFRPAIRRDSDMLWNGFLTTIELLGPVGAYGVGGI